MEIKASTEYGPLQKVLIQPPGREQERVIPWEGVHSLLDSLPISSKEAAKEWGVFRKFLEREIGPQNVLTTTQLLTQTFETANGPKREQMLYEVVGPKGKEGVDHYLDQLRSGGKDIDTYDPSEIATDLTYGYPRNLEMVNGEVPKLVFSPKRTMMWARDSVAVTPFGAVICSMSKPRRMDEPALTRVIFKHHPELGEESILLDMLGVQEQDNSKRYILEGGNIKLLNHVLVVGTGNPDADYNSRTNIAAAEVLTKKLFEADSKKELDQVVLVSIPDLPINIHEDSVFNMVGPKTALSMPYIFGYPDKPEKVWVPLRKRLVEDMQANGEDPGKLPQDANYDRWGTATVYTRDSLKSGKDFAESGTEVRFFDHLVNEGLLDLNKISWVGGNLEDHAGPIGHLMEALKEQANLGANVFTTSPYRAIGYHRNRFTVNALKKMMRAQSSNSHLELMPSNEHRTTWGGPHCLTMPLLRN